MCFLISFGPATFWLVIGYFVLFSSTKAEGNVQVFGRFLSIWIFAIATFIPIMGAYVTLSGLCPIGDMISQM
jgi:hypothetical protein